MEAKEKPEKNKGGRPPAKEKKDQLLSVKCSVNERKEIEGKAGAANLSVSEYMREMALSGKIQSKIKVFPKEVLQLTGTLNHLAANLNQIAKKRNGIEELSQMEREQLYQHSVDMKQLAALIKSYFL